MEHLSSHVIAESTSTLLFAKRIKVRLLLFVFFPIYIGEFFFGSYMEVAEGDALIERGLKTRVRDVEERIRNRRLSAREVSPFLMPVYHSMRPFCQLYD